MQSNDRNIETIRLPGHVPYAEALRLQTERRKAVETGQAGNALFLLEHTPVFTLGRKFQEQNLLKSEDELHRLGIDAVKTDRGGDVTYHGPGQLVAYPILNLNAWKPSIQWYLRTLEDILIAVLADYGLQGERVPGLTGVWVNNAKVAAIGIGLHNWVTYHGIALNVAPNMTHFQYIIPCGITNKPVTSLQQLLPTPPTITQITNNFEQHFLSHFS